MLHCSKVIPKTHDRGNEANIKNWRFIPSKEYLSMPSYTYSKHELYAEITYNLQTSRSLDVFGGIFLVRFCFKRKHSRNTQQQTTRGIPRTPPWKATQTWQRWTVFWLRPASSHAKGSHFRRDVSVSPKTLYA